MHRRVAGAPRTGRSGAADPISSLANQGCYQEALAFAHGNPWPALEPWFALCEWHLGLGAALDRRLAGLGGSSDPALADFAAGMRAQVRT